MLSQASTSAAGTPAEGQQPTRKRKSRWEEPSPSTAVALVGVPKEITLPGGIKVSIASRSILQALSSGHTTRISMQLSSSEVQLRPLHVISPSYFVLSPATAMHTAFFER